MPREWREIFKDWKKEALGNHKDEPLMVGLHYGRETDDFDEKFIMGTNKPGWYIGLHGNLIDKYSDILSKRHGYPIQPKRIKIEFIEIDEII